jgi:hypothetical protein
MKRLLSLTLLTMFLTPLLLGVSGCAGPKHEGGSTYEKSKSDYEKKDDGSGY